LDSVVAVQSQQQRADRPSPLLKHAIRSDHGREGGPPSAAPIAARRRRLASMLWSMSIILGSLTGGVGADVRDSAWVVRAGNRHAPHWDGQPARAVPDPPVSGAGGSPPLCPGVATRSRGRRRWRVGESAHENATWSRLRDHVPLAVTMFCFPRRRPRRHDHGRPPLPRVPPVTL
jgi:hypothetical protein